MGVLPPGRPHLPGAERIPEDLQHFRRGNGKKLVPEFIDPSLALGHRRSMRKRAGRFGTLRRGGSKAVDVGLQAPVRGPAVDPIRRDVDTLPQRQLAQQGLAVKACRLRGSGIAAHASAFSGEGIEELEGRGHGLRRTGQGVGAVPEALGSMFQSFRNSLCSVQEQTTALLGSVEEVVRISSATERIVVSQKDSAENVASAIEELETH